MATSKIEYSGRIFNYLMVFGYFKQVHGQHFGGAVEEGEKAFHFFVCSKIRGWG
jgi:hypothetical protein